jgi:hypothetical protein
MTFKAGDFIVEQNGTDPIDFGVVIEVCEDEEAFRMGVGVISVRFPEGVLYSYACHCQPYKEWLNENGF